MKEALGKVLLLPMLLHEEGWEAIPKEVDQWIKSCDVFFVENEKTTRRFFKKIKPIVRGKKLAGVKFVFKTSREIPNQNTRIKKSADNTVMT